MNRKAAIAFGLLWAAMLAWHLAGRTASIAHRLPDIAMSPTERAAVETGDPGLHQAIRSGGKPGPGATEFERFRTAFERYPAPDSDAGADSTTSFVGILLKGIFVPLLVYGWVFRFAGWNRMGMADRGGLILVLGAVTAAAAEALLPRSAWSHWDAWAVWDFKTKAVLHEGWFPKAFLMNPEYGFAHPEYPLLWPWAQAVMSWIAGGFDTRVLRMLPVACACVLPFLITAMLAEAGFGAGRWLVAGMIVTLPRVLDHSSNGYVDWPLAAMESVALLLAMRSRKGTVPGWVVGLAAGLAANLKMEGLIFGIGLLVALSVDERGSRAGRKSLVQAAVAFFCLALPWQIFRVSVGIPAADFGLSVGQVVSGFPTRAMLFVRAFALEAFGAGPNGKTLADWWVHLSSSWLLFWFAAAYVLIKGWRRLGDASLRIPVIVLGVQVLGALGAYATTIRDPQWLLTTSLDRLMLQWVPAVTVIAAALLAWKPGVGGRGHRV